MSLEIVLFGGRMHPHPQGRPAWDIFKAAVAVRIRDGKIVDRLEYEGWDLDRQVGIGTCFKAATIVGDHAYTCTNTELLKIDLRKLSIVERHSDRWFNDLHHVNRINERYFVAGTGTDSVLEYDNAFELKQRYPIGADQIVERFGHETDFRCVPNTKPHAAHPNFVSHWDGETWVTNFESRHVESLTSSRRYKVSDNKIHDGVPALGRVWFTAVNGEVITMEPHSGTVEVFDLNPMTTTDRALGWCRGIAVIAPKDVVVGFSKLRETKIRENLKWLGNRLLNQNFALSLPTRIARYDLERRTETWRLNLEEHDVNAVFSIHIL